MTQALFTSMTGLNAGTEQLTVVSDNVANMNTTAYKTSRVDFQDIWYQTRTTGTNSTAASGGTNPYQVGVGVRCSSITKDMGASSINTTGRTEDMAIQGNGWFTVANSDGAVMLTRDGTFSLDEEGFLCTANGCKVLGMDETVSLTRSDTPMKLPVQVKVIEEPTPVDDFADMEVEKLNGAQLTGGTFITKVTLNDGTIVEVPVDLGDITDTNMQGIVDAINNSSMENSNGDTVAVADYFKAEVTAGTITFTPTGDSKSIKFEAGGSSNFVTQTKLSSLPPNDNGTYTTKVLNKSAFITGVDDVTADTTKNLKSFSVGVDGLVTATYSDGSTLTVRADENNSTYFSYTDSEGYIIDGDILNSDDSSLVVDKNILVKANMQMQFAKVVNDGGLVAVGNNMYEIGVNAGDVLYSAANWNGIGALATGALETSNVDLAQQFSNMILAQRLVQANSQVFSSANSILETLVYLGRG